MKVIYLLFDIELWNHKKTLFLMKSESQYTYGLVNNIHVIL